MGDCTGKLVGPSRIWFYSAGIYEQQAEQDLRVPDHRGGGTAIARSILLEAFALLLIVLRTTACEN